MQEGWTNETRKHMRLPHEIQICSIIMRFVRSVHFKQILTASRWNILRCFLRILHAMHFTLRKLQWENGYQQHVWTWSKFIYTKLWKNVNYYNSDYFKCSSGESRLVPHMITRWYLTTKFRDQFQASLCMVLDVTWRGFIFPQVPHIFLYSMTLTFLLSYSFTQ